MWPHSQAPNSGRSFYARLEPPQLDAARCRAFMCQGRIGGVGCVMSLRAVRPRLFTDRCDTLFLVPLSHTWATLPRGERTDIWSQRLRQGEGGKGKA